MSLSEDDRIQSENRIAQTRQSALEVLNFVLNIPKNKVANIV